MSHSSVRREPNWVRYLSKMLQTYRNEVGDPEGLYYRQQLFLMGNALYRDLLSGIGWYRASFRRSEIRAVIEGMRLAESSADPVRERFIEIVEEVMTLFEEEIFANEPPSSNQAGECPESSL